MTTFALATTPFSGIVAAPSRGNFHTTSTVPCGLREMGAVIVAQASAHYGITIEQFRSYARPALYVEVRQAAAYLLAEDLCLGPSDIARTMGKSNHATAIWALRQARARYRADWAFRHAVTSIRKSVEAATAQGVPLSDDDQKLILARLCEAAAAAVGTPAPFLRRATPPSDAALLGQRLIVDIATTEGRLSPAQVARLWSLPQSQIERRQSEAVTLRAKASYQGVRVDTLAQYTHNLHRG